MRLRRLLLSCLLTLGLALPLTSVAPVVAAEQCFPETGFCVAGSFLDYWLAHGGLAINGYPLTGERQEKLEDGNTYLVQWFERVRLEYHPENIPPNDVLLGQFGRQIHPADPPTAAQPGQRYFPETGHNMPADFAAFWEAHGGLAQFGYPLSEVFTETLEDGRAYQVQYTERARFERHPENQPPYTVLLGQFGRRLLAPRPAPAGITARAMHTATLLPTGLVLVVGGFTGDAGGDRAVADAYLYHPATGQWAQTSSLTTGRQGHTATLLPDGSVLAAGGYTGGFSAPGVYLASVERYDPAAGTWSAAASMSMARARHSATLLRDGRVLVVGGDSAELYDPATNSWSPTGPLTTSRGGHTATLLTDGTVLVAGGTGDSQALATAERYDPATGAWSAAGHLAAPRENHTATLLGSGAVLIAGGIGCEAAAERYDPVANAWVDAGRLADGRDWPTATAMPDGTVLVAGGYSCRPPDQGEPFVAPVERYDPATGTWSKAGELAIPRGYHTATLLPDGRLLLLGGLLPDPFEIYAPPGAIAPPASPLPGAPNGGGGGGTTGDGTGLSGGLALASALALGMLLAASRWSATRR